MSKQSIHIEIIDEHFEFTLIELCQCCTVKKEIIIAMVEEGMLSPAGSSPDDWRFTGTAQRHVEIATHLQRDLRVNLPGAALVLELMEEIEQLRNQINFLNH